MAPINHEDLQNEEVLQEKLKDYSEKLEGLKVEQNKLIHEQAEILTKKLEEFTPVMKFMRANRLVFNHPTLNYHSTMGPVLDYDSEERELYVYDVDSRWIKKLNLFNQEDKKIVEYNFVANRSLDNALAGIDYLLSYQDKVVDGFSQDVESRRKWIEENQ